ncbi:MAG: hypothetical protein ABI658_17810 [Acidimicrobiales bacterium]
MTDTLRPPPSARADRVIDRYQDIPHIDTAPPGTSMFRRRIRLRNIDASYTVGELEDDCHHFRVELRHDGESILSAAGEYLRGPWTTCQTAGQPLRAIEGHPLRPQASALGSYAEPRDNCTHLFDLTGLAMAHACRAQSERQYDMLVTDMQEPPALAQEAIIWCDGAEVVRWQLEQREVVAPEAWAGVPLRNKFIRWAEERLDPDTAEAAVALRRVIDISMSRVGDLDRFDRADGVTDGPGTTMMGRCMTYSPQNVAIALRVKGSARSWHDHGHLMLADMHLREVR